jgi:hypothetical protein
MRKGEQLYPDGSLKVAALFATPSAPRRDRIMFVRDFVVSNPVFVKGKAELYVEYVVLGHIDPSNARLSTLPSVKMRADFEVIKPPGLRSGSDSNQVEPGEWRIAGPVPEPHLTVDAAIHYASEVRENAKDDAARQKADTLLAALKRFH